MVSIGGQMKPVVVLRLSAILLQPVHRGRRPRRLRKPRAALDRRGGVGGQLRSLGESSRAEEEKALVTSVI